MGSYVVPQDWYVWAAGNRKEDRAAVFDMPAPLANRFLYLALDIASAVGTGAAAEFAAYTTLYKTLPNLEPILQRNGNAIAFPEEPSVRYATTTGLTVRAQDASQAYNAFNWLSDKATAEWVQLFAVDMFRVMRSKGQMGALAKLVQKDSQLQKFLRDFQELVGV